MWVYIVRRLFWLPVLLAAASLVTFTLGTVGPGDPVRVMLGNKYREDVAERLRADLGLDKPFLIQYRDYMWKFVQGDFGESFRYRGQPVRDLIVPKMWVSAQLSLAAMAISLALGLPLGFFIAHRQGRWEDPATVAISLVLMSIPIMVTVPALLWGLCLKAHWIPCSGWGGIFDPRIVVPAITMGVPGVAGFIRFMRASTLDVMGQDFIRTAHSKGLSTLTVDRRHVLRNAMIPHYHVAGLLPRGADRRSVHHGNDHGDTRCRSFRRGVRLQQGLSGDNGRHANRRCRFRACQPAGGRDVCLHRPEDPIRLGGAANNGGPGN